MPPTNPIPIAPTAVPYPPTPAPSKNLPAQFPKDYLDAINQLLKNSAMTGERSYSVAPFVPPTYNFYNPNAGMQVGAQEVPNLAYMKYIIDKYYADNFPGQRKPFPTTPDFGQQVGAQEFPIKRYGPNDLFQQNMQQYVTEVYRLIMDEKKANYRANQNPFNAGLKPNPLMPLLNNNIGVNPYIGQSAQQRINFESLPTSQIQPPKVNPKAYNPYQQNLININSKANARFSSPQEKPTPQPATIVPSVSQPAQKTNAPNKTPPTAQIKKQKQPTINSYIPRYERD